MDRCMCLTLPQHEHVHEHVHVNVHVLIPFHAHQHANMHVHMRIPLLSAALVQYMINPQCAYMGLPFTGSKHGQSIKMSVRPSRCFTGSYKLPAVTLPLKPEVCRIGALDTELSEPPLMFQADRVAGSSYSLHVLACLVYTRSTCGW